MAKVDKDFLSLFQYAVEYIYLYGFANYTYVYGESAHYKKVVLTLTNFLDRNNDPAYGLPSSTLGWSIDEFCTWAYAAGFNFLKQDIPAAYASYYSHCMDQARADGLLKRRAPFRINQAKSKAQFAVWNTFANATACFADQIKIPLIINPDTGYKSRGYWFNASLGSGLFYYDYFMQQTLNIMFGPLIHDKYPFNGQQQPIWCSACERCEEWSYSPMFIPDFLHTTHDVPLMPGTYTASFNTRALPDPTSPTPGDPDVLWVRVGAQGLNSSGEPTGPISFFTINPIGPAWSTGSFSFTVGPSTTSIYVSMEYQSGIGDYLLYFRNYQFSNFAGDLVYLIYGAEGNGFGWEVGAGIFTFKQYTNT